MKISTPHVALRYGAKLHPTRDWFALLSIISVLFVVVIIWSFSLYRIVEGGGVLGEAPVVTPTTFNTAELDALETLFITRAAEEKKYRTGEYSFIDPSK